MVGGKGPRRGGLPSVVNNVTVDFCLLEAWRLNFGGGGEHGSCSVLFSDLVAVPASSFPFLQSSHGLLELQVACWQTSYALLLLLYVYGLCVIGYSRVLPISSYHDIITVLEQKLSS
ncbi:hypothetical protein Tco_0503196 [Tanacetum coccineum]